MVRDQRQFDILLVAHDRTGEGEYITFDEAVRSTYFESSTEMSDAASRRST